MKEYYVRRLPHWQPRGAIIFVTMRLFGSLPKEAIERLSAEKTGLENMPPRPEESPRDRALREGKKMFAFLDRELDKSAASSRSEPVWLARPDIAGVVRDSLRYGHGTRYTEHRYAIMPNHVHWLIEPLPKPPNERTGANDEPEICYWPVQEIAKSVKTFTARIANRLLSRSGPFWQTENYDHWVRDEGEFWRIVDYIDRNPVTAGLRPTPEEWPWSSAGEKTPPMLSPTKFQRKNEAAG